MTPTSSLRTLVGIEPLEARIAPATIIVGAPGSGIDTNYSESPFVNTETGGDQISQAVGPGGAGADTFYLKLSAGDKVQLFTTGGSFDDFITVKSGTVIAFFIDNLAGSAGSIDEVQAQELVGFSFGKSASVEVRGSVFGDIVTNYDDATGTVKMNGLISAAQNISSLSVGTNVVGGIYSGGSVTNVSIQGSVEEIVAGTAANGKTFDFFPGVVGGEGTLVVTAAAGVAGPSISKITVESVADSISAGAGGTAAQGGSLLDIKVINDSTGFLLHAGAGGAGAPGKANGGAGGDITTVLIPGVSDPTGNSPDGIRIVAGDGGDGTGKGGAGGKITSVFVGYENSTTATLVTPKDSVHLLSGIGGDGKTGGAGGLISNVKVAVTTSDDPAEVEVEIIAGAGGAAINASTGKAGAGGSISNLNVQNKDDQLFSDIEIRAGAGGVAGGQASGAAGGSISSISMLASEAVLFAGNGSNGKVGGAGGSVSAITFTQIENVLLNRLQVAAGIGGNGSGGAGGNGGNVSNISNANGDLTLLEINGGSAANGGSSASSKGGNGGNVTGLNLIDIDVGLGFAGEFIVRSGAGANGKSAGGSGGLLDKVDFLGLNLEPTLTAGSGGNATGSGSGGKGGIASNLNIFAEGSIADVGVSGNISAGSGGAGTAAKAKGGIGGDVKTVNLSADLDVTVAAGNGGNGGSQSVSGKGGSISTSAAFGNAGFGVLAAGDAGTTGIKAALGGSIIGGGTQLTGLRASTDLTITGGDGSHGGAGGSIKGVAFGSTARSLNPTPTGNILVQAGNGSAQGGAAGAGGSIDVVQGSPSSGTGTTTHFVGGAGGGAAGSSKSGAGGSVSNITLTGFDDDSVDDNDVVVTIEAGNAGGGGAAKKGGNGGDVKSIAVIGLDPDAVFRSVAAGDGAAGTNKGGLGGTIDGVNVVGSDIGIRSGQTYGYETMGGVFAGAGGAGSKAGLAGSVRNISADGIAAIVAGRNAAPQFAETVEKITLNVSVNSGDSGDTYQLQLTEGDLVQVDDGGDVNYRAYDPDRFGSNALVGAVADPTRVDANKFAFVDSAGSPNNVYDVGEIPIDGLIMAKVFLTANPTNFVPEALLTSTGFFDSDNKNS